MEQFNNHNEYNATSIRSKVGVWLAGAIREAIHQISLSDLNPNEAKLRQSVAPPEYLPEIPDYPPTQQ